MTEELRLEAMLSLLLEFERDIRVHRYGCRPERADLCAKLRARYDSGDRSKELSDAIFDYPRI